MRKLISIVLCLAMVLGSAASAFADTSQGTATTLRLEKTEGKVAITKAGGKSVTVKEGTRLYDGYEIKTDKKSAAYVSLDSSKAVMLDASTDVTIKKSGKKLEIMLKAGTVLLNVEDKLAGNEEMNIRTTNSVTGIRGTIVQASFNPKTQNSEIYLFEGMTTGKYLAPDGSWYTQTLTTGSWLASGMGMLKENPDYNGWTVGPNGEWIYTNNKIEGTQFRQWRWSADQGWFTFDTNTGAVTKQEAWPFTFKDLQPRVQKEILGTPSMLTRGQEHLDLYPELAEKEITATRETAGIVLTQQEEEMEKQDAAIKTAFEAGNGGKTNVDNLFKETANTAPSVPTYPMIYLMDDPAAVTNPNKYTTQYYEEGDAVTAPADPAREGHTFTGWSAPLPAAKAAAEEMVYATWTINQYTLSFVDSDGVTVLADPITADYGTPVNAPANPTKTGYTFTGWDATVPTTMPGNDMTFKAKWGIDQHTITFNTNGGSTIAPITQDYGTTVTAPADPTRTGYTFAGWDAAIPTTMPETDMTITAAWTANEYTITYDHNGGIGNLIPQTFIYDNAAGSAALTNPADVTLTGYKAIGWASTATATSAEFTKEDTTYGKQAALAALADNSKNITLYTVWEPITYSVRYNGGSGAEGTMTDTSFRFGETKALTANEFTLTGYDFVGWVDSLDKVDIDYSDGQTVENLSADDGAVVNLYAKWEIKTIAVSINDMTGSSIAVYNGESRLDPNPTGSNTYVVDYGTTLTLTPSVPAGTTMPVYSVTDGTGKYYATENGNSFNIPVISSADMNINIGSVNDTDLYTISIYYDDYSTLSNITGKVLKNSTVNNISTLTIEGEGGVTFTVEGLIDTTDDTPYGIENVKYNDGSDVEKISYNAKSGTYKVEQTDVTTNVYVTTAPIYEVTYGAGLGTLYTVNDTYSYNSENTYYYITPAAARPDIAITLNDTSVITDAYRQLIMLRDNEFYNDFSYDEDTGTITIPPEYVIKIDVYFAASGYNTVTVDGTLAPNIELISTDSLICHYVDDISEVYLVTPDSEFVFDIADADVSEVGTAITPLSRQTDGYYHVSAEGYIYLSVEPQ